MWGRAVGGQSRRGTIGRREVVVRRRRWPGERAVRTAPAAAIITCPHQPEWRRVFEGRSLCCDKAGRWLQPQTFCSRSTQAHREASTSWPWFTNAPPSIRPHPRPTPPSDALVPRRAPLHHPSPPKPPPTLAISNPLSAHHPPTSTARPDHAAVAVPPPGLHPRHRKVTSPTPPASTSPMQGPACCTCLLHLTGWLAGPPATSTAWRGCGCPVPCLTTHPPCHNLPTPHARRCTPVFRSSRSLVVRVGTRAAGEWAGENCQSCVWPVQPGGQGSGRARPQYVGPGCVKVCTSACGSDVATQSLHREGVEPSVTWGRRGAPSRAHARARFLSHGKEFLRATFVL